MGGARPDGLAAMLRTPERSEDVPGKGAAAGRAVSFAGAGWGKGGPSSPAPVMAQRVASGGAGAVGARGPPAPCAAVTTPAQWLSAGLSEHAAGGAGQGVAADVQRGIP
eukprot:547101-Alexandrium_andersonii.AAC.1